MRKQTYKHDIATQCDQGSDRIRHPGCAAAKIHSFFVYSFIHSRDKDLPRQRGGLYRHRTQWLLQGAQSRSRKQAYEQIISKYKLWQSVEGMVGQAITGRGQLMQENQGMLVGEAMKSVQRQTEVKTRTVICFEASPPKIIRNTFSRVE